MMNKGFTLVELSIVLVIIGLLIGGILVGQSLVDSARINSQIKQLQQFDIAYSLFEDKFRCIPGDCTLRFGGNYHGQVSHEPNGNGVLNDNYGNTPLSGMWAEGKYFFIHLTQSNILKSKQKYTYIPNNIIIGESLPEAEIGRGGISVNADAKDIFYFLGISNDTNSGAAQPYASVSTEGILSPAEALAIDSKEDDGNPLTGNVAAVRNTRNVAATPYPMTIESNSVNGCINNNIYNTSLSATNLCRILVKTNYYK